MTKKAPFGINSAGTSSAIIVLWVFLVLVLVTPTIAPVLAQDGSESPVYPPWDGQRRFTVLVLGMDRRPGARDTLNVRVDAILIISVNPAEQSIGMLHIPRDMRMTTPYNDHFFRINTLLIEGEDLQEGYGPYYAMDTFQYNLGMYIDRYIAFDFEAFITIIDALGGIDIYNPYPINDTTYPDMNYGYDPFYLAAGSHHLNGRDALRFARTRHPDNDIYRGERQMQIITAIHERISERGMLPQLLQQAPQLFEELRPYIYTDLALSEILQLGAYAVSLSPESIHTGSIDLEYSNRIPLQDGSTVYIPNSDLLPELLIEVFGERYFE